jgi:sec-independent protein translocase protein TatC
MGLVFEIPVVCWIMGRLGIVNAGMMKKYRRHVVVLLLVLGAIITPTADVFTLMLVSLPMWLLYELSIHIVGK